MSKFIITASIDTDNFAEAQEFARALGGDTNEIQFILGRNPFTSSDVKCDAAPAAEGAVPTMADAFVAAATPDAIAVNPNYTTFGINVYESDSHAFALGKKLYRNKHEAAEKQTRNGGWVTSFDLRIDLGTGQFVTFGDGDGETRCFAVKPDSNGGIVLTRGYDSASEAVVNNPGALAVVAVNLDDDNHVSVMYSDK